MNHELCVPAIRKPVTTATTMTTATTVTTTTTATLTLRGTETVTAVVGDSDGTVSGETTNYYALSVKKMKGRILIDCKDWTVSHCRSVVLRVQFKI